MRARGCSPRADDYLELLGTLVAADDLPRGHAALVDRLGPPQRDDGGHLLYGTGRGPADLVPLRHRVGARHRRRAAR